MVKKILLQCRGLGFNPWVGKIPWRRAWQPTPIFLSKECPRTEEPGGLESTGSAELDTTEQLNTAHTQPWHRTGKGKLSFQSQRKALPQNVQTVLQLHSVCVLRASLGVQLVKNPPTMWETWV